MIEDCFVFYEVVTKYEVCMLDVRSRLVNLQLKDAFCDVSFNLLRYWLSAQLKVIITS